MHAPKCFVLGVMVLRGAITFPRVIVVTGTPGVGKSVCSHLLANRLSACHIELGKLVKEKGLVLGFDSERASAIADLGQLSVSLSAAIERACCDCVVDGYLASHVLDRSRVDIVYVLRCDPNELLLRLRERGFSESKAIENAASEVLGVCLWEAVDRFGEEKVAEVDTSSRPPMRVVKEMVSILEGRSRCVVGRIDWLSTVSEQGLLEYFFR